MSLFYWKKKTLFQFLCPSQIEVSGLKTYGLFDYVYKSSRLKNKQFKDQW